MKHSKLVVLGMVAAVAVLGPPLAQADSTTPGIVNSPHDFTVQTNFWVSGLTNWVPQNDVCEECHTPHKAQASYRTGGPLWAHPEPGGIPTYVPFTSAGLTANGYPNGAQPGWASLACLSCHDGSIAINQLNGSTTPTGGAAVNVPSFAQITTAGNNLSGTHPIGISYDTVQGNDPSGFNAPSSAVSDAGADTGKSISKLLLFNETAVGGSADMVECASCHDIHQRRGVSGTASSGAMSHRDSLIVGAASPQNLCLTCHIK